MPIAKWCYILYLRWLIVDCCWYLLIFFGYWQNYLWRRLLPSCDGRVTWQERRSHWWRRWRYLGAFNNGIGLKRQRRKRRVQVRDRFNWFSGRALSFFSTRPTCVSSIDATSVDWGVMGLFYEIKNLTASCRCGRTVRIHFEHCKVFGRAALFVAHVQVATVLH